MITNTDFQNVALAISAYAQERWTQEKTINSTGIVAAGVDIDTNGESFIGQMRWYKPVNAVINNATLNTATDGSYSTIATDIASYIKNLRTYGIDQVNMQSIISKQDGIAVFSSQAAMSRVQDENNAVMATLKGVAAAEVALGAGIVNFDSVPDVDTGMFVDINAAGAFGAAATTSGDERRLVDTTVTGAARGERLFRAAGMAFKDYEPDYMYLITSPETLADFRAANIVDEDRITDGNIEFQTLFGGKFRLVLTRAAQGNLSASANVNDRSVKTTFLVKPGSVAFKSFETPVPVEIGRHAAAYQGGGSTHIWYRYGFVSHPLGYDWVGATSAFATNTTLGAAASWERKVDYLNLGILPILHA
jgi:hypothetical protein